MEKFELNILGCGSALPTTRHFPTSQVVNLREKLFMIDCGEGAQLQFRKSHLKFTRLNHIFISHQHGDHCFGLLGLVSTLGMLGRTADLHIHSPQGMKEIFIPVFAHFCRGLLFKVIFDEYDARKSVLIYEDRSLTVTTIPLRHRIPCSGFLFEEKRTPNHLNREMLDFYHVPISELNKIKNGANFMTSEGEIIPNDVLTFPSDLPRKYAYCSDTLPLDTVTEQVKGVDLLFHEATFSQSEEVRAKETFHSTAAQAAQIALEAEVGQLVIGHYSARYNDEHVLFNEASAIFPHTILAEENLCIPITYKGK